MQFGHVIEVHAVDTRQKSEWNEDDRKNGQHFKYIIKLVTHA